MSVEGIRAGLPVFLAAKGISEMPDRRKVRDGLRTLLGGFYGPVELRRRDGRREYRIKPEFVEPLRQQIEARIKQARQSSVEERPEARYVTTPLQEGILRALGDGYRTAGDGGAAERESEEAGGGSVRDTWIVEDKGLLDGARLAETNAAGYLREYDLPRFAAETVLLHAGAGRYSFPRSEKFGADAEAGGRMAFREFLVSLGGMASRRPVSALPGLRRIGRNDGLPDESALWNGLKPSQAVRRLLVRLEKAALDVCFNIDGSLFAGSKALKAESDLSDETLRGFLRSVRTRTFGAEGPALAGDAVDVNIYADTGLEASVYESVPVGEVSIAIKTKGMAGAYIDPLKAKLIGLAFAEFRASLGEDRMISDEQARKFIQEYDLLFRAFGFSIRTDEAKVLVRLPDGQAAIRIVVDTALDILYPTEAEAVRQAVITRKAVAGAA